MPIELLFIIVAGLLLFGSIIMDEVKILGNLFILGGVGILIWILVSLCFVWRPPNEFFVKPVNVNGAEIVVWYDKDNIHIFNVNTLGRTFNDNFVKVFHYTDGYYAGIWYRGKVEYDHFDYKIKQKSFKSPREFAGNPNK